MPKRLARLMVAVGAALLLGLAPDVALADKRVALVVGNSKYQTVNPLPNPARDATAITRMFKDAGFENVDTLIDVGNLDFKRGIRKFEDTAADADIAVIYYAGHGIEIGGTNYLIPVDARLASDRDAPDEAITLDRLVTSADSAKKLRVVILDACRDNPFTATMRRDSLAAKRGISSGLTRVDPSTTDTLIAYAAKAGSTAEDGDGDHSPFTSALLRDLTVPGRDIRIAFGYVKDDVMKSTSGRQEPFVYGSLGGGVYSLVPPPAQSQEPAVADAKADFELVKQINTRKAWDVYLNTYKTGIYADLARGIRDSLPADIQVASLGPTTVPQSRPATTKEALDWDKIKDSTDQSTLQNFIKRYPDSPLAITAQDRINALIKAAQDRAEQDRLAKEAADRKAAELAAAKQQQEDERKAKAAEAEQKAKADEAARQAAAAKAKADAAAAQLAAAEAAKLRQESERAAQAAEVERQKAASAAATEAVCKQQGDQLAALQAKGSTGAGVDDMTQFVKSVTCDRIKPQAMAALNTFNGEAAKRTADLVRSAQTELTRIGCYTGTADGVMSDNMKNALSRYLSAKGLSTNDLTVTDTLVSTLQKQQPITCLRTCPSGQALTGDTCVAAAKPAAAPATQAKRDDSSRKSSPPRQQADTRPAAPRATQQAAIPRAAPGGYGGGAGHTPMVGVGF
jgi:Caspase domain